MKPNETERRAPKPRADIVPISFGPAPDPVTGLLSPDRRPASLPVDRDLVSHEAPASPTASPDEARTRETKTDRTPAAKAPDTAGEGSGPDQRRATGAKRGQKAAPEQTVQKGVQFDEDDIDAVEIQVKTLRKARRQGRTLPDGFDRGVNFSSVIRYLIRNGLPNK